MRKLWLNKVQAQASGKPCLIPYQVEIDGEWVWDGRWTKLAPTADILLPYTRCKEIGCPVQNRESPDAYVYNAAEKSQFRYVPFWARFSEDIDHSKITDEEGRILGFRRGDGVRNLKNMS
ncbi:hypothetical protein MUG84_26615 [Paenibacillus sp. KQZ6P-2]|uniref:Uncharacterized protein n=1 Tax=Paenibacillus mangrovi TaxID=2931978 RepID=A0A9X1WVC8_9BACL|nr:hypothetical protein [Paenibacillus mangrovi]MCJ8015246.1 hypothetical protein [Paenibacillus mangrovi]